MPCTLTAIGRERDDLLGGNTIEECVALSEKEREREKTPWSPALRMKGRKEKCFF